MLLTYRSRNPGLERPHHTSNNNRIEEEDNEAEIVREKPYATMGDDPKVVPF